MNTLVRIFAAAIGGLALLALLHGQTPAPRPMNSSPVVGALGSPELIDFSGNETFTSRALRQALSGLPEFLLAAHPAAPVDAYLALVQQALERGYRNNGFLDASVAAAVDSAAGRVRVMITEGPRFLCGDIRVEGLRHTPVAEIERDLTAKPNAPRTERSLDDVIENVMKPYREAAQKVAAPATPAAAAANVTGVGLPMFPSGSTVPANAAFNGATDILTTLQTENTEAFWSRDEPAPFREGFPNEASTRVRSFLAGRGHSLARVKAALVPDAATKRAHLHLEIDEGPATTIGRIVVVGARMNSAEEIIRCAGLVAGTRLTPATLAEARIALWNSTRFYTFDIAPKPAATPASSIDLLLTVTEIPSRPPLREPLSATDAALVRFANWVTTQATRREMAFTVSHSEGTVSFAASPTEGVAFVAEDPSGRKFGSLIGSSGVSLFAISDGRSARRELGRLGTTWTVHASLLTAPQADPKNQDGHVTFGANWQSRDHDVTAAQIRFELTMSPAFACQKITENAEAIISAGELVVRNKETGRMIVRTRADTGELLEWALTRKTDAESEAGSSEFQIVNATFASVARAVRTTWNELPESAGQASLIARLLEHPWLRRIFDSPEADVADKSGFARARLWARFAEHVLSSPEIASWWRGPGGDKSDPEFTIPQDPSRVTQPGAIAALFGAMYYKFSTLLWPADTWPARTARELFYIISGHTKYTAPVLDELHRDPAMGPIGSLVVAQLLRNHQPRAAWRFARRALDHASVEDFRRDCALLLDNSAKVAQIAQNLLRSLATIPAGELDELITGLPPAEAALAQRSLARVRQDPGRPVSELLQPMLDEWWASQAGPALENRISDLLAAGTVADPAIAAFTINGEPVHRKFLRLMSATGPLRSAIPRRPADTSRPPADVARDGLVGLMLLAQEFAWSGGFVKSDFLEQKIAAMVKNEFGGDWQRFTANLTRLDLTTDDQREIFRLQEIAREMRQRITRDLPRPTPAEIQQALRTLPPAAETRTLQAILVPKASAEIAAQIRAQAVQEGTFANVWAQHDKQDPALPRRTLMPDVTRRDFAQKELADAAFALEPAGISPVIESGDLCYIFHLVSRNSHDSPAEKRTRATNVATNRKCDAAVLAHIDQLKAEAIVRLLDDPARTVVNTTPPAGGTRIEFESLKPMRVLRTRVASNTMTKSGGDARWSGGRTVFCTSDKEGWAEWHFTVPDEGVYRLDLLAVRGPSMAQVQAAVDGKNIGDRLELHAATRQPSGAVPLGELKLAAGLHQLRISVVGKHPSSSAFNFGLDALDLVPAAASNAQRLAATPASAPDLIEIISMTPGRTVAGRPETFKVRVKYSLGSNPKGIIGLGFNTAVPKSYRMIRHHRVDAGSGEAELTASVTPAVWPDGTRFAAYVNLSPDPHPNQWTPLASHSKIIEITTGQKTESK